MLTREDGKPVKDFRKAWENLTARAGLPNLIVHDLRRSAAKALRAAGVPESVVMAIGAGKRPPCFAAMRLSAQRTSELLSRNWSAPEPRTAEPRTAPISAPIRPKLIRRPRPRAT